MLSTAEAISLLCGSMALAGSFGNGKVSDEDLAAGLAGAVIKEEDKDVTAWKEYLENVMKKRGSKWSGLYNAGSCFKSILTTEMRRAEISSIFVPLYGGRMRSI